VVAEGPPNSLCSLDGDVDRVSNPLAQRTRTRWIVGDPQVVRVEASSTESAIVTALSPGISRITGERRYADGTLSQKNLKDSANNSGCGLMPDIVFEIVP
jgi:hypothetical protein